MVKQSSSSWVAWPSYIPASCLDYPHRCPFHVIRSAQIGYRIGSGCRSKCYLFEHGIRSLFSSCLPLCFLHLSCLCSRNACCSRAPLSHSKPTSSSYPMPLSFYLSTNTNRLPRCAGVMVALRSHLISTNQELVRQQLFFKALSL